MCDETDRDAVEADHIFVRVTGKLDSGAAIAFEARLTAQVE